MKIFKKIAATLVSMALLCGSTFAKEYYGVQDFTPATITVPSPTLDPHAATKKYVDDSIVGVGANTALSNLSAVEINDNLTPGVADSISLGSTSKEMLNAYIGDVGKLFFGLSQDISIYRSASDEITIDASGGLITSDGLTVTDNITEGGNAVPNSTDNLGFFSSTSSAQFLDVISDETGTGSVVGSNTPILVAPEIGAATMTSAATANTTYADRLITSDTGGVLNISIGGASGDDFTIDISKFVVEGDTGRVGIGTSTPSTLLDVNGTITGTTITDDIASLSGGVLTGVKLGSLTSNGFVKTSGGDGTLSIDTSTYLTTETDPIVGAINGIPKADGGGNISTAVPDTDYQQPVAWGVGLAYSAPTASVDTTELDALTWSDGLNTSNAWTFDVSGTDHTMTAGNGLMTFSNNVTASGALEGATITEGGNAVPNSTDNLSFFSPTTSSQFFDVISDESGSGTVIGGTSPTIGTPVLTLEDGNGAAPTSDGQIKYNRTTERLQTGNGGGTEEFVSVGTLTDTKTCTWDSTGKEIDCDADGVTGPASSVNENISVFDGVSGSIVKDGLISKSRVINSQSTALISGGDLSINADTTKFDVAAGTGIVCDNHTDPSSPTCTDISFGPFTAITPAYLTTGAATFISVDDAGALVHRPTLSTPVQLRDTFDLGAVVHSNLTNIDSIAAFTGNSSINLGANFNDASVAYGVARVSGLEYSANGSNLQLDRSAGDVYATGINWFTSKKNPNFISQSADTGLTFVYSWQDGGSSWNYAAVQTAIVPGKYDDGTGGASTPNGTVASWQWQTARIWYDAGSDTTYIQYGQTPYNNKDAALTSVIHEHPEVNPVFGGLLYAGALVVKGDATDLSDLDHASFIESDKFGQLNAVNGSPSAGITNLFNIANGSIIDEIATTVTSNGSVVTFSIERAGTGSLVVQFEGNNFYYDTDTPDTIALTAGSDIAPTQNFVYLTRSGSVVSLNANTTGFPSTEHAPVAEVFVQSAPSVVTDGPYDHHQWTNEMGNGQGHLDHLNFWIRHQNATWLNGVVPTTSITVNGGAIDNVYFSSTSGNMLQLHQHAVPVLDMSGTDPAWVVNDSTTAFDRITDLSTIDTDSTGATLRANNTFYSLVAWINQTENADDTKIYINAPSCFYSTAVGVTDDINKCSNYTIPGEFKGAGFLVARINLRYQTIASGTITEVSTEDLRGLVPSTAAGGGGTSAGAEFSDNLFRVFAVADSTKEIAFDASLITTGTTRTFTFQDATGTLALLANKLSDFAATTSAEFFGTISDESGSGSVIGGTSPTITTPTLVLEDGNGAAPTTDGQVKFDRITERFQIGNGASTEEFVPIGTLTDTKYCVWDATGKEVDCNAEGGSGASTALDNLASVQINSSLLFDTADTYDIGSTIAEVANAYIGDVGKLYFGLGQDASIERSAANEMTITATSGVTVEGVKFDGGVVTGASSISSTGFTGALTGNASTATALETTRAIYGNNFDGTAALDQVIASTYGGTGNGFTKLAGATTSEKTYTLPDASVTILYSGGDAGTPSALVGTNISGAAAGLTAGTATTALAVAASDAAGPAIANEAATTTNPTLIPNKAEMDTGWGWASDVLHAVLGGADEYSFSISTLDLNSNSITEAADIFVDDGAQIGISGNEFLTFNSAGNITVSGADLAIGANNITMSGSIGVTGTRVTKGWFIDVESTNMYSVGGTSLSSTFSPIAGGASIVITGALDAGSITSNFGTIDNGASSITTTGDIAGGGIHATGDTSAGDSAALGYTAAEGLILTGQGSTSDVTIKNDADGTVLSVPTGTTNIELTGNMELGHATDTTLSRSAAGVLAVEGDVIPDVSSTNTLTNKRITTRVSTEASSATPTINTDNVDAHSITALAADVTSMTTNLSGTPVNFDKLIIRFLDNGTARAITWGTSFQAMGVDLPTTTTASKVLTVGLIYDSADSKWGVVAVSEEE